MEAPWGNEEMREIRSIIVALSVFLPGSAFAESIAMCGQTVEYTMAAPEPDVPADMRAFSGVWVGGWETNKLCSVLVVEAVEKDGAVKATYIWGTYPGWNIFKPGFLKWSGAISSGALKLPPNARGDYVAYKMKNPQTLDGLFNGRTQGTFTKR